MLKKRIIDFDGFVRKAEQYWVLETEKLLKNYSSINQTFPNGKTSQNCVLCQLPIRIQEYNIKQYNEEVLCSDCYFQYIETPRSSEEIKDFKAHTEALNKNIDFFNHEFTLRKNFSDELDVLNQTFKDCSLKEVEYVVGQPLYFGSLDRGLESGFWKIGEKTYEFWFQSEYCISVNLAEGKDSKLAFIEPEIILRKKSIGVHVLQRIGLFLAISVGFSYIFKILYKPFDRTSIVGSDSSWYLILFNFLFILIFSGFLIKEANQFGSKEKGYRNANLVILIILIIFIVLAVNF